MPPKKKAANGYKLAEPLPKDEILSDLSKKKWKLGTSIGKGGFGEIYCAQPADVTGNKYSDVIKIEPHSNGPLFVEMHFYMRCAKAEDIQSFMNEKDLSSLGMPVFRGSGSHEYKGEKYRFVVMERFGTDIWKMFLESGRKFPEALVFQLGLQILDVLEYIHSKGYVHADIKGANILTGITKETKDKQVYLVDFGLATKYDLNKEFKPDPKKAHDGTIEYLSRDAHLGVQTRRGDLEILIYNLIQWLGCTLPWEKNLSDPKVVQASKEEHMATVAKMTKACFGTKAVPEAITAYLKYLSTLKFNTEPDYDKLRKILLDGLKSAGGKPGDNLKFSDNATTPKSKRTATTPKSKGKATPKSKRTPSRTPVRRKKQKEADDANDAEDDEEVVVPPKKKKAPVKKRVPKSKQAEVATNGNEPVDPTAGYTPAMLEIINNKLKRNKKKATPKKMVKDSPSRARRSDSKSPAVALSSRKRK